MPEEDKQAVPVNRRLTAIVQVTDDCNLRCKYCFIEPESKGDMSEETFSIGLDRMLDRVGPQGRLSIIYHGGEPLMRGIDFFKFAQGLIAEKKGNRSVRTNIQTNGTLIDDKIADYLVESGIGFGVSLDGPPSIHDANRIRCDGKGSFNDVMRGVDNLRKRHSFPGAIAVMTRRTIENIPGLYSFFNGENIGFKISPVDLSYRSDAVRKELEISPMEYGKALIELFDLWFADENTRIDIVNFSDTMRALAREAVLECTYSKGSCGTSYIGLSPNGDVYPCNRFTSMEKFKVGNILTDSLDDIFASQMMADFRSRRTSQESCVPCEYNKVCNSGCASRANSYNGTVMAKDYYCTSTKMLFRHIARALNHEITKAEMPKCQQLTLAEVM